MTSTNDIMDAMLQFNNSPEPPESFETVFLDPKSVHFYHDGHNLSFIASDGTEYPRITLRRSFPLSADNSYIVVRVPDDEPDRSHELGIIMDVSELGGESRNAVEYELRSFHGLR